MMVQLPAPPPDGLSWPAIVVPSIPPTSSSSTTTL